MSNTLLTNENYQTSPQVSSGSATYTVCLRLNQISRDGGTQSRAEINYSVVEEYAEAFREGATFPPVILYYDGEFYWIADGFHRVLAAEAASIERIAADVRQGTRRDAVLHSVGANACHGLRRTNVDKHKAVETLLRDEEWSQWSDREIARRCGVSNDFVSRLRKSICHLMTDNNRMVQRKGKTYTLNTTKIGSKTTMRDSDLQTTPDHQAQEAQQLESSAVVGWKERFGAQGGLPLRARVVVTDDHPLFAGQHGTITGRPSPDAAIVVLDGGARERILIRQLQPEFFEPSNLVTEPKSKDKQLFPSIQPNLDVPPDEPPQKHASFVNGCAIAHGQADVVAVEIAIGIRHLTPEQLAWVISSAANNGLSNSHLEAVIEAAKQALTERHHPE